MICSAFQFAQVDFTPPHFISCRWKSMKSVLWLLYVACHAVSLVRNCFTAFPLIECQVLSSHRVCTCLGSLILVSFGSALLFVTPCNYCISVVAFCPTGHGAIWCHFVCERVSFCSSACVIDTFHCNYTASLWLCCLPVFHNIMWFILLQSRSLWFHVIQWFAASIFLRCFHVTAFQISLL